MEIWIGRRWIVGHFSGLAQVTPVSPSQPRDPSNPSDPLSGHTSDPSGKYKARSAMSAELLLADSNWLLTHSRQG